MLLKLTPAQEWQDEIYVDPDRVAVITRKRFDRNMGEYSTIIMHNGERFDVAGLPSHVAKLVRDYTEE